MKRQLLQWCAGVLGVLVVPAMALANPNQGDHEILDARLEGFPSDVTLPAASTGLMWMLLVVLGAVCVIGLFKDARRTHLD